MGWGFVGKDVQDMLISIRNIMLRCFKVHNDGSILSSLGSDK